jgi:hypothetical protein
MPLNDEDTNEFIRLYKEEFREDISFDDAKARAEDVITLLLMLMEHPEDIEDAEK